MKTYGLHLESGPKRMKTMVHVPELLGCVANGPTTDAALAATPESMVADAPSAHHPLRNRQQPTRGVRRREIMRSGQATPWIQ